MAQVKFYSVTSLPPSSSINAGGIYFVDGGELYKGAQRFGLGRVTVDDKFNPSTSSKDGQAKGDIVVTGNGAGWVYAGSEAGQGWQKVGGDFTTLQSSWQADISAWVAGLASSGSGPDSTRYITNITQGADGKVTAHSADFANAVKNAVGNSYVTGEGNGVTVSVSTTGGAVTGVNVAVTDINCNSVTAGSATFTDLTVTSTANFTATEVVADSLTVGGKTVEQIANGQIAAIAESTITSTATGITVGVTTKGGSVTAVSLNAEAFANAMHFLGVGTVKKTKDGVNVTPPAGKTPVAGDIVIDSTTGLEAIYTGTKWELIGDNAVYALNAYTSTAAVYSGVETVPGALDAAGAAIDALKTKTGAYVGGTSTSVDQGVSVKVTVDANTMAPTVETTVTSATLFAGLDANVSSSENNSIKVGVTQVDGKVTAVTADLVWLGADG